MKLREYKKEDADTIVSWIHSEEDLYKWSADIYKKYPLLGSDINEKYLPQLNGGRFFPLTAVDQDENILGHFIIRYPKEDDDSSVRFGFVIVNPHLRGKGYGKEMLGLGIEYVKKNHLASRIDLGVFENNESARHCYEALGFKAYSKRECELPIGKWTCIDMEIFLNKKIETDRLILREYTMDDFEALYQIMSDPETMQHYPAPFDEERTRRWIEWNLENYKKYGWGLWALVLKETGDFIGDCGITLQNIDGQMLPEIGYHVHKKYWRRGLAKEAARAVRDWVFENTSYDAIYSYMKYTNVASYSTALANGMKKVKEYPDPKNQISYAYAISRDEWNGILKFSRAEENQIEEIFSLYKNAIAKMDEQKILQWDEIYPDREILLEDVRKNQMFVGKKNGRIAVCFVLNEECDEEYKNGKWICPDSRFCVIHRLCVNPDFQNQGIAGKAMKHIEDFCRKEKYDSIRLDCFTQNPFSKKLYDKGGYKITGYADWRKGRFELREKILQGEK